MLRLLDELLWALRREGFGISTAQAIDGARAAALVGFGDRAVLRDAIGAVVVQRAADVPRFREVFEGFFAPGTAHGGDLWGRLADRGFSADELCAAREVIEAVLATSAGGGAAAAVLLGEAGALEGVLASAGVARAMASMTSPLQAGYFAHRVEERAGLRGVSMVARRLRDALRGALGDRGAAIAEAFAEETDRMRRRVRAHVDRTAVERLDEPEDGEARAACDVPFAALSLAEEQDVRRAVQRIAEKLRGADRVRRRHARRGAFDPRKTLRRSLRTGGVPFQPARRRRRRDKPRLWVLCDVSDSVRAASRFLLELVSAVHELFAGTRSFVFVSELAEVTELLDGLALPAAFGRIASGRVVPVTANSNYGRAIAEFERRHGRELDRRATVVVLGDGRTNYHDGGVEAVRRLRDRCRALYWVCPEGRGSWGAGDSAMRGYEAASTKVLVARTARELADAARAIVARR